MRIFTYSPDVTAVKSADKGAAQGGRQTVGGPKGMANLTPEQKQFVDQIERLLAEPPPTEAR